MAPPAASAGSGAHRGTGKFGKFGKFGNIGNVSGTGEPRRPRLAARWPRSTPDPRLRLLAHPLVAPALPPHPGGGVGVGDRIEDVSRGEGRRRPGRAVELEEPEPRALRVDRSRIQHRFATG